MLIGSSLSWQDLVKLLIDLEELALFNLGDILILQCFKKQMPSCFLLLEI